MHFVLSVVFLACIAASVNCQHNVSSEATLEDIIRYLSNPTHLEHLEESGVPVFRHPLLNVDDNFYTMMSDIRLYQAKHHGYSRKQRETEEGLRSELQRLERRPRWTPSTARYDTQYSLYNGPLNYGPSQLQFIQRKVHQLGSTSRQNSVSIDNLIRWKSSAQQRIERLEALLENSNLLPAGNQEKSVVSATSTSESRHQQQNNDVNSRTIRTLQSTVSQLQRTVQNLQTTVGTNQGNTASREPSAELATQKSSITENRRHIRNLQTSVLHLQRTVQDLGSPHGARFGPSSSTSLKSSVSNEINFEAASDAEELVRHHEERLNAHDDVITRKSAVISSIQHQLMRLVIKDRERVAAIKTLQSLLTNSATSRSNMAHLDFLGKDTSPGISKKVEDLRESVSNLEQRLDDTQSCCGSAGALRRRMELTTERVNQARTKVDESSIAIRVQKRMIDEMTSKQEMQRIIIKRLQDTLINYQRGTSRLNRNLQESIRTRTQRLNQTISTDVARRVAAIKTKVDSDVSDMQRQIADNKNDIDSTINIVTGQMQKQINDLGDIRAHLDYNFPQFEEETKNNLTEIARRLFANGQSLFGIMRRLDEIAKEERTKDSALDIRVRRNLRSIESLQSSLGELRIRNQEVEHSDDLEDSVLFLNISFHQLRSSLQRHSNRAAAIHAHVERLASSNKKTKERLSNIRTRLEGHISNSINESYAFHKMMTSDTHSLRQTVASRLDALSMDLTDVEREVDELNSKQTLMTDTITGIALNNAKEMSALEGKTDRIVEDVEDLSSHCDRIEQGTRDQLSSFNTTFREQVMDRLDHLTRKNKKLGIRIESNLTDLTESAIKRDAHLINLRHAVGRLTKKINSVRTSASSTQDVAATLQKMLNVTHRNITSLNDRLNTVNSRTNAHDDVINTNRENIDQTSRRLTEERAASNRIQVNTLQTVADLRARLGNWESKNTRSISDTNDRIERLSSLVTTFNNQLRASDNHQDRRLVSLESINGTLRALIGICFDDVDKLDGSIENLRQTDVTLFDSIELHEKALTEHRKLHRNLTVISDSVKEVIHEHGEALDTVQDVVHQINESLTEEKEHINEEMSTQIQRQLHDIKSLHFIMRNFTSLVQNMIRDRLNQEITLASVQMRQRSLQELLHNHAGTIDRLNQDTTGLRKTISITEAQRQEEDRQLERIVRRLSRNENHLRSMDVTVYQLADKVSLLNVTVFYQRADFDELEKFSESNRELMYSFAESLTLRQEEFTTFKSATENLISGIQREQDGFELENHKVNETLGSLTLWKENVNGDLDSVGDTLEFLDAHVELIAGALNQITILDEDVSNFNHSLAQINGSVRRNAERFAELQESVSAAGNLITTLQNEKQVSEKNLQDQQTNLRTEFDVLRENALNCTEIEDKVSQQTNSVVSDVWDNITNIKSIVNDLRESMGDQQTILTTVINEAVNQQTAVDDLLWKVAQQELTYSTLNTTDLSIQNKLKELQAGDKSTSDFISELRNSAFERDQAIQSLETTQWNIQSRMNELTSRMESTEDQVSLMEARFSGSQGRLISATKDVQRQIGKLENNVTSIVNRMTFIEYDQDNAYNITSTLFETIREQTNQISILNQSLAFGPMDVFASFASTIATIEQSVFDVNETLSAEVTGIAALLVDFQLAFDTSGRQMERMSNEIEIMEANSTNYFDYFSTALDYLRQIARETNDAVGENRDRVRVLNSTMLLLQVLVPAYIQRFQPDKQNGTGTTQEPPDVEEYPQPLISNFEEKLNLKSMLQQDEEKDIQDGDYNSDYSEYDYQEANGRSVISSDEYFNFPDSNFANYPQDPEYDLESILNGDADQARLEGRVSSSYDVNNYEDYQYFADEEA
ncbi:uncharacterized protein LOC143471280 isoform X4 [Clavelina lepadiformis]|uniref:uncharacterized protein LOC143471280 isoform X4 n=1 Tax=Clavelina lepadiformis TaxID=159417 RepID=UPI0040425D12